MGKRNVNEILEIKEIVKKLVSELKIDSPARIMEVLEKEYNKKISKPVLLKMVSEFRGSTTYATDLELAYENHPEIIAINNRIKKLQEDFNNTESVNERCKISGQIDSAQETKLKLKKILRETELMSEKGNKILYRVYFDGPKIAKKENDDGDKNCEK